MFLALFIFPEDFRIKREHLIKLLIAKGVIEQKRYKGDEIVKCHTMLNKLENLCLLEGCKDVENVESVKMHDLIRDMALQILRQHSPVMVRPGMQPEEFPDADKWEEDLETVSVMNNHIKQVTSGYSVMCSKLSTLLLCYNRRLTLIHNSFFQQFYDLKVLDLSETSIEILPSSISNLVRLTALLLRKCEELRHVSSLGNLQELKMLDLSYTRIEQVPHGMELPLKLKYLDMYPCSKLLEFPIGILPNLSHLEFLRLDPFPVVRGEEMGGLKRLKYLECGFDSVVSFNNYMQLQNCDELHHFKITVFQGPHRDIYFPLGKSPNMVILSGCDIGREFHKLPKGTNKLVVLGCQGQRSLFPSKLAAELRCIEIIDCSGVECLLSWSGSSVCVLEDLVQICLFHVESLLLSPEITCLTYFYMVIIVSIWLYNCVYLDVLTCLLSV